MPSSFPARRIFPNASSRAVAVESAWSAWGQFLIMATMKSRFVLGPWAGLLLAIPAAAVEGLEVLPQTKPLDWEERDLSSRLMDGAHRFIERKIAESVAQRGQFWARD